MPGSIRQVSEAARRTGDAGTQVLQATGRVGCQSDDLRGRIERFVSEVRAA